MTDDRRSAEAQAYRAWYRTARWQRIAKAQLHRDPLCAMCQARGRVTAATVADHVTPHRGNRDLFWHGELQSLCGPCHSGDKQREEHAGYRSDVDANGYPVDPRHPWLST